MRILLINHYAGSTDMGMEFRPYYMAREWIKLGHQVDIIAAEFSHLRQKNPAVTKDWQENIIDGIHYHWIKTGRYSGNGVKRALTMFEFVYKIWLKAKYIAKNWNPDVIITSSTYPLDTYAGQRIRKFAGKGTILIHEIHDMWPLSPIILGGMSKYNPFILLMQMAENSFCKNSDIVVSLLPNAKEYLIAHGMNEDKFYSVANGVVLDDWNNPEELKTDLKKLIKDKKDNNKFVICFFGSHTDSYNLDILIKTVQRLNDEDICVLFVGDGIYKEKMKEMVFEDKKTVERFLFYPYIPKKQIPSLLSEVDAIYIGAKPCELQRYGICMNKMFDSMMGAKPIIFSAAFPNNYVAEYNCGITVSPESSDELTDAIHRIKSMSVAERNKMGENGRKAVCENFTYDKLAKKFEQCFINIE